MQKPTWWKTPSAPGSTLFVVAIAIAAALLMLGLISLTADPEVKHVRDRCHNREIGNRDWSSLIEQTQVLIIRRCEDEVKAYLAERKR